MLFACFAALLIGYLFGSFPTGYLAGLLAGVDIRKQGSGNIGATNVLRVVGKKYGYAVFLADVLKGFAAVNLAHFIATRIAASAQHPIYFATIAAVGCIVGHAFPVWLRFKGGKGVATSAGAMFGLMPVAATIVLVIWILVFEVTRYVSVASVVAAAGLPVAVAILIRVGLMHDPFLVYITALLALLVVWRHRSNFARLRAGTEQRFTRK
ncbi:MAG TPA: glycerol-3-phosphate 1-O-acyltransferase PlsY [Chthoniobacterales bacterium]|nr:glycerol-3-phosphate 1-O-acyltransferase PlsY [Chthoniobacterales bacterium]